MRLGKQRNAFFAILFGMIGQFSPGTPDPVKALQDTFREEVSVSSFLNERTV